MTAPTTTERTSSGPPTARRPQAAGRRGGEGRAVSGRFSAQGFDLFDLLGPITLAAVTLAAAASLHRAFQSGDWLVGLVVQGLIAHTLVAGLRHARVITPLALAVSAVAAVVTIVWFYAPEATTFGLPGPGAIQALARDIDAAVGAFGDIKAPVEPIDGLLIWSAAAVWASAIIGDWWAFRLDATLEAVLPAGALFIAATILGADRRPLLLTGLFAAAVMAYLLVRAAARHDDAPWAKDQRVAGSRQWLAAGLAILVVAMLAGVIMGPRIPGAQSEGAVDLRRLGNDDGPETRVTVSPLVDIRSRLVNQTDVVAFTVTADRPAYWRLTALDRFDGRIWSSTGSYGDADGDLDDGELVRADRTTFTQEFRIRNLSQLWAPAAYEPAAIVEANLELRYDEQSGTLIVGSDVSTSDGAHYTVSSATASLSPEALAGASPTIPDDIAERYLTVPTDVPESVRALAADLTASAGSTYDAMLALQSFFRDNFDYSLDVGAGHGVNSIVGFLEARVGYCEQFAGTFAAMARILGVPARVAVGFTPGDEVDGVYVVRGRNAHAWPEVYLGGYGWVAFEPTPGRGAPGAESYTGVPAQQASPTAPAESEPVQLPQDDPTPTTQAPAPTTPTDTGDEATTGGGADDDPLLPSWARPLLWALVLIIGVLAAYLGVLAALRDRVRRQRQRRADSHAGRIGLSWREATTALAGAGSAVRRGETPTEFARRAGERFPDLAVPLRVLAGAVTASVYGPATPSDADVSAAADAASVIVESLVGRRSRVDRLRDAADPRLVRSR